MNLLTNEQIAYLKSLESKKKRRKFFLDCLVENSIGESEKIYGNFDFLKDADSPRYLLPHEIEEIQRLNPSFTNTTAPRTFESIEGRKNYRVGELIDFVAEEVKKEISKTEESKWSGNVKLEDIIKSKLIIRGFKNETLLNNRGLIVATIEETANEVKKCYEYANEKESITFEEALEKLPVLENKKPSAILRDFLLRRLGLSVTPKDAEQIEKIVFEIKEKNNSNPEAKYTEEDIKEAFNQSRLTNPMADYKFYNFDEYLKFLNLKNDQSAN